MSLTEKEGDLLRELKKAADALRDAQRHFDAQAEADAALHLAQQVRPNPLASRVALAAQGADLAITRYEDAAGGER